MRAIYVPLSEPVRRALVELAEREYRDPRDQATKLLIESLRSAGALPAETATDPSDRTAVAVT